MPATPAPNPMFGAVGTPWLPEPQTTYVSPEGNVTYPPKMQNVKESFFKKKNERGKRKRTFESEYKGVPGTKRATVLHHVCIHEPPTPPPPPPHTLSGTKLDTQNQTLYKQMYACACACALQQPKHHRTARTMSMSLLLMSSVWFRTKPFSFGPPFWSKKEPGVMLWSGPVRLPSNGMTSSYLSTRQHKLNGKSAAASGGN